MKRIFAKIATYTVIGISIIVILLPALIFDPILSLLHRIFYGEKFSLLKAVAEYTSKWNDKQKK